MLSTEVLYTFLALVSLRLCLTNTYRNTETTEMNHTDFECPVDFCVCDAKQRSATCSNYGRKLTRIPFLPSYVTRVILDNDNFTDLTQDLLRPLSHLNLTDLRMRKSGVNSISKTAFSDLEYLQNLDLNWNSGLDKLSLKLSFSSLRGVSFGTLSFDKININSGDLGNMLFSGIEGRAMEEITLIRNNIKYIPADAFRGLANLKKLSLSRNRLENCSDSFNNLSALKELDLSYNRLFYCDIDVLPKTIEKLFLHRNLMTSIRGKCSNSSDILPNLHHLLLDNNHIYQIKRVAFNCFPFLKYLSLSGNKIRYFPGHAFSGFPSLKYLILSNMQKSVLWVKDSAFDIPSLVKFSFQGNLFSFQTSRSAQRGSLNNCSLLVDVDLSRNTLPMTTENIKYLMKGLTRLETLRLVNVGWTRVPDGFFRMFPYLTKVTLSQNAIVALNSSLFSENSKITEIHLDNNGITHVGPSTFSKSFWRLIKKIDLSGNPYACDCTLLWFRDQLRKSKIQFLNDPKKYKCHSPPERKNLHLLLFNLTESECREKRDITTAIVSSCAASAAVLLSVFVVYKGRWHIRYWIYLLRYRRSEYTELREVEYKYDAFVIYTEEDAEFVHEILLPKLEGERGYKLCIHFRDFVAGKIIVDNIVECMTECRQVIAVLSKNFCRSKWCKFELNIARDRWLNNESDPLVLVMIEDLDSRSMNKSIREIIKTTTFALWTHNNLGQNLFWQQLLSALKK